MNFVDIFLAVVVVIIGVVIGITIGRLIFGPIIKKSISRHSSGERCKRN